MNDGSLRVKPPEEKKRKTPRRIDVGALLAATEDQRRSMASILAEFKDLPENLRLVVASQIRKEQEQ